MRDYRLYIKDIAAAMESIDSFVRGLDERTFETDDKTSRAVLRKLEIIGEAAKQIPDSIRRNHPEVPWTEMAGTRDRLIYAYFGVDYKLVWKTITERIPQVKPHIHRKSWASKSRTGCGVRPLRLNNLERSQEIKVRPKDFAVRFFPDSLRPPSLEKRSHPLNP